MITTVLRHLTNMTALLKIIFVVKIPKQFEIMRLSNHQLHHKQSLDMEILVMESSITESIFIKYILQENRNSMIFFSP